MHELVVVGAGPVGMTVAALCAAGGLDTVVVERRSGPREGSRAIGVMPASLEILDRIGLGRSMVERGLPVRRAFVHDGYRSLGQLHFSGISGSHPYVLVMPQVETEDLLRRRLAALGVPVLEGTEVVGMTGDRPACLGERNSDAPGVLLRRADASGALGSGRSGEEERVLNASWIVWADGFHGQGARHAGVAGVPRYMPYRFIMGDTVDHSGFGNDAHLWFTPRGAVESFPLTHGRRRWIAQLPGRFRPPERQRSVGLSDGRPEGTPDTSRIGDLLRQHVQERTGYALISEKFTWTSSFIPVTRIARRAGIGRCFLVGDALHTMSPIGGQGMNSGLADAELLADLLVREWRAKGGDAGSVRPLELQEIHRVYRSARMRSGRAAARRAALGTRIGSLRGRFPSALRSIVIAVLLRSAAAGFLASHFTMRTIPFRRSLHSRGPMEGLSEGVGGPVGRR